MKFKAGDQVITTKRGTALLGLKEPAEGVVTNALPAGHPDNWFGDREDEIKVKFADLPKQANPPAMVMKNKEIELALKVKNVRESE